MGSSKSSAGSATQKSAGVRTGTAAQKPAGVPAGFVKALEERLVKKHAKAMGDIAKLREVIEEQKSQGKATAESMFRLEAALQSHMQRADSLANPDTVLGRSIAAQSETYLSGIERVVQAFQTTRADDHARNDAERAAREARELSGIKSLTHKVEENRAAYEKA